jgi:hypothetical protein
MEAVQRIFGMTYSPEEVASITPMSWPGPFPIRS